MAELFCSLSHLLTNEREYSNIVAIGHHRRYLWRDFVGSVNRYSQYLRQLPQKRWLLYHDDAYQFATGFMALLHSGKVIVLPPNSQLGTLQDLANNAEAMLSDLTNIQLPIPIVCFEQLNGYSGASKDCNRQLLSALPSNLTIEVLTSGSDGASKCIVKQLHHFESEIQVLECLWGKAISSAFVFSTVSHQHIYGLLFRILWPLCAGRVFVNHQYPYPEALFSDMCSSTSQLKANYFSSVLVSSPAHLTRIPDTIDLNTMRKGVAAVFCSGGVLPKSSAMDLKQRLGMVPIEVFGSSETGGVAWKRQQQEQDNGWNLFDGISIRLTPLEEQLEIKSPFCFSDDWFVMGDKADICSDGVFHLKGRADRIVKVEEKRLSLTQMENRLSDSEWVNQAKVLLVAGKREIVGAVVVPSEKAIKLLAREGKRKVNEQIKRYLLLFFERVLLPKKFRYIEKIPVNAQGKIVMSDLALLFSSNYSNSINSMANSPTDSVGLNSIGQIKIGQPSNIEQPLMTVLESSPSKCIMLIDLPEGHKVFAGHFPQWPILPGVVQLDIATRQAQHIFYSRWSFKRVEKLKFQSVIQPGKDLQLVLQDLGEGKVSCCYCRGNKELSSGRIVFGA